MENKNIPKNPWKGSFYYDPKDARFTVPRPIGKGWTFNFGHRIAWIFMAAVVFIVCCVAWLKVH